MLDTCDMSQIKRESNELYLTDNEKRFPHDQSDAAALLRSQVRNTRSNRLSVYERQICYFATEYYSRRKVQD